MLQKVNILSRSFELKIETFKIRSTLNIRFLTFQENEMNDKGGSIEAVGAVEVDVVVVDSDLAVIDLEMTILREGDHHKEATTIAIEAVIEETMEISQVNIYY